MPLSGNTSFVLKKAQHAEFESRPTPEISAHEVLVEVKKTGICGSDIHYLLHGRIGDYALTPGSDMVLGHESSGVVSAVGSSVTHLKPGDRVAIEPGATCRKCDICKEGRYQLCPNIKFAATPPYDGTLSRYYAVPSDLAYPLPSHLTLEDGAMMEPLSVAVHAVSQLGGFKTNQSVAVFGCGPVGILCMAVAKALGASRIIAVDIVSDRLQFAKSYVGTEVYQPPPMAKDESQGVYSKRSAAMLRQQLGIENRGPTAVDLVVDASGAEVSIQTGIHVVKFGGTYVQVGMGSSDITIDMSVVLTKELIIKGSFRYGPGDYSLAIALTAQGKIDLKPLVTHRFPFEHCPLAFQTASARMSDDGRSVIKTIISGPGVDVNDM